MALDLPKIKAFQEEVRRLGKLELAHMDTIKTLKEEIRELKEYQPKGSRVDAEALHDYMKAIAEKHQVENEKLKWQIYMMKREYNLPDDADEGFPSPPTSHR